MPAKIIKRNKKCPYWSIPLKKCQISGGGLFIPQDDHSETYCSTSNYPQCLQFILHNENRVNIVETNDKAIKNRRKYIRITATHEIIVNKLPKSEEHAATTSTSAKTLDVGIGGIRLALDSPLEDSTLVHLYFDESFPENLQHATGQVTWCNKQIDEPGYHAGISFKSERIIEAMERHLNR